MAKRLDIFLIVVAGLIVSVYAAITHFPVQASTLLGQGLVNILWNPFVSGFFAAIIAGIVLHYLLDRKPTQEVVLAVAFLGDANAQLLSRGTVPVERQQDALNDIRNQWQSFRVRIENSQLTSEFRSQLRERSADTTAYLWTKANIGGIPSGTMLTGLTGDLIFSITTPQRSYGAVAIYIPPGFSVPGADAISTIRGEPMRTKVLKASPIDRYGPGWTVVFVSCVLNSEGLVHNVPQNTITIRGVTAPAVAGKYFFKIARVNEKMSHIIHDESAVDFSGLDGESLQFIPIENWPVMHVKGEFHTSNVTGTIRYGDFNRTLYNSPIHEAGKVWLEMREGGRIDPYTNQTRRDLPTVNAVAYFNAADQGHYEVEGVAPGIYSLYVSAAGYPKMLIASEITILRDQSLQFDGHLQPGPVIHGRVLSKRYSHDLPWRETSYVKIELYDAPTLYHIPDPSARMVSWTPVQGLDAEKNTVREAKGPQDVGPSQRWFVQGGTTRPFLFEFGARGDYGAPRDLDGMVPQLHATWVDGLTLGTYRVRAWVLHYIQSTADGSTFQEYPVNMEPDNWIGREITLTIELRT